MKCILQQTEQDCLLACFTMILSDYGIKRQPWQLAQNMDIGADGLSSSALRRLCAGCGLSVKGYRGHGKALLQGLRTVYHACIVHLKDNHFVVATLYRKNRIKVLDPAIGSYILDPSELMKRSSGAMFFCSVSDQSILEQQRSLNEPSQSVKRVVASFGRGTHLLILMSYILAQAGSLVLSWGLQVIVDQQVSAIVTVALLTAIIALTILAIVVKVAGVERGTKSFDKRYSNNLFKGLLSKPLYYFDTMSKGALMERLNLRMTVRDTVLNSIIAEAVSALTSLLIIVYVSFLDFRVAALIVVVSVVFLIANQFVITKQRSATIQYIQNQQDFGSIVQRELSGIEEQVAAGRTGSIYKKWVDANDILTKSYVSVIKASSWTQGLSTVYSLVMSVLLALYSAIQFKDGGMSLGIMLVIQVAGSLIESGVKDALNLLSNTMSLKLNAERHDDLFESENRQYFVDRQHKDGPLISVDNLGVTHEGQPAFESLNLAIEPGTVTYVIGPSGAGKTSMIKALIGVQQHQGTVDMQENLRKEIGVSFAETEFGGETVHETVCSSDQSIKDTEIWATLHKVGLDQRIQTFPLGLDSRISEDGKNLSNGEKKRLALARALLNGRKLVVLDEPFNGLDNKTKRSVYQSMTEYSDRAFIIVTHDLDIISGTSSVIYLDGSTTPVIGKHHDLVKNNKNYQRFFSMPE